VVASDPLGHLPAAAAERLREVPTVVVDERDTATAAAARVAFVAGAAGIDVLGTVHRMDGVPIPLRAPLSEERPGVEDVLAAIEGRLDG
jgi:formylmethanofuran dehydrogenase subunit B